MNIFTFFGFGSLYMAGKGKIRVTKGGPYRVTGGLPLIKMVIKRARPRIAGIKEAYAPTL